VTTPLIALLIQARETGIVLSRQGDRLNLAGPHTVGPVMRALAARKADIWAAWDYLTGAAAVLDWTDGTVARRAAPCQLCGRYTPIRDPYDRLPHHKTCSERALAGLDAKTCGPVDEDAA
jgi:hypothetical protein